MKLSIKKTFLALAFSSLAMSSSLAQNSATNMKEIRNEVGIMLNILQASLKQQSSKKNMRFKAHAVFYLANQGVVFEIGSSRRGGNWFDIDLGGLNDLMSNLPIASSSRNMSEDELNININENEIERMVKNFVTHGDDYDDDFSDKMRDLNDEQRDVDWEKRELERTRRDLDFEKRNADSDRRKEIVKEMAKLNKEVTKLEAKKAELQKFHNELEAQRNQEMVNRRAVKKKLYKESLAIFEDTIGDMLCRYGAGLRSLADDENITFLLSDFIDADDDSVIRSHDKVYVFKNKDVNDCVTGKSDKNKLLAAANSYIF
ncbi:hypothetical protein [uncultured Paraglaciecola sp.]|uniref:hypothetical protein n=1 Tax=uncultured Paraglaciecola sp. TaxID=1765024 RepID=UPI00262772F9|nr:hypothetical protein [uncultured Paraglaciecola sp.]